MEKSILLQKSVTSINEKILDSKTSHKYIRDESETGPGPKEFNIQLNWNHEQQKDNKMPVVSPSKRTTHNNSKARESSS
jgi:hypothetical protein